MPQYIGSSTPLTAGSTYTSPFVLTDIFDRLTGSVFTDQAGTLYIEQSGDGTNADISAHYAIAASTGEGYAEDLQLPWARLRFTNTAGSNQTVLRLFSRFRLGEMP